MTDASAIKTRLTQPWEHGQYEDFSGITCHEALDLSGLSLCGVDFSRACFKGPVTLKATHFRGISWFAGATFEAGLELRSCQFDNDARFENTTFLQPVIGNHAEFRGVACFDGARFDERCDFSNIVSYGNFALQNARFVQSALFKGAEFMGGLWCDHCQLPHETDFDAAQVHGRLWLRNAQRNQNSLPPETFNMSFGYVWA
ncbi:pentapeptide repeat-containing protein [Ochrobactrum sp. GPK 3]|uniref:pentapeptide repeat-containing protein n=1 Tax=Brucella sp. 22210 TaxID=3453892 RepID=UPI0031384D8C